MSKERIEITPYEYVEYFFKRDAFLVTMDKDGKANIMALAWKTIGELWGIPVITAAVAPSRYSFKLLTEGKEEFSINIPSKENEREIMKTGTLSGQNTDKFEKTNLEKIIGTSVKVPTIRDCMLSYECKIVHKCESGNMASHKLFFGKIVKAFASEKLSDLI